MKTSLNKKQTIIAFIVLGLFALIVAFGTWYYLSIQSNGDFTNKRNFPGSEKSEEETETAKHEVPEGYVKVVLNGTEVYHPKNWGTPKTEKTKENITGNIETTYKGEYASWDLGGQSEYWKIIEVTDFSSLEKDKVNSSTIAALENTYNNKKIDEEDLTDNFGYIPPVNAGVTAYEARYAENYNGSWRGYWYVGAIGQDYSTQVHFVSVMYNKEKGKVVTVDQMIRSDKSVTLSERLANSLPDDNKWDSILHDREVYLRGVYKKDNEINKEVDSVSLKVVELVK